MCKTLDNMARHHEMHDADAIRTRVFESFFTTKEVRKGTGQGPAQAHSVIVKKHLGRIRFETRMGSGTTFFVNLPLNFTGSADGQ